MFEEWLKFWRYWMFWWLPGGDEPADTARTQEKTDQQTTAAKTAAETTDVDVAATRQPGQDAEPRRQTSVEADDLTAIKGIGPAIAGKLNTHGVRSFDDLARADPVDLAEKIASRPVTVTRVREWIADAKKRAS
ncbi:DUF4332 domain-containing protein [Rhodovibrio salinarum]|uniref:DUF4332 domain-containing protein n=1 Tax=Rhodovibrio salinarum TaxID=1087 RepID=A0A934QE35_9PROT|nr:DUF4332 domain-containing protein [Rhodovibrio salinarum]MBK1695656.1 DUF4332 domain-containing protein [Rhodovibrio salinarum]